MLFNNLHTDCSDYLSRNCTFSDGGVRQSQKMTGSRSRSFIMATHESSIFEIDQLQSCHGHLQIGR